MGRTFLFEMNAFVKKDVVAARAGPNAFGHTNRVFIGSMWQGFLTFVIDNLYYSVGRLNRFENTAFVDGLRNVIKDPNDSDTYYECYNVP